MKIENEESKDENNLVSTTNNTENKNGIVVSALNQTLSNESESEMR